MILNQARAIAADYKRRYGKGYPEVQDLVQALVDSEKEIRRLKGQIISLQRKIRKGK